MMGLPPLLLRGGLAVAIVALGGCGESTGPDVTAGAYLFRELAVGADFTCGARADSTVLCWGHNHMGQLGYRDTATGWLPDRFVHPTPAPIATDLKLSAVTAGWSHACGITTDGTAYCWGDDGYGQLGDGAPGASRLPTAVTGGLRFAAVRAGFYYTCGIALDGTAYCWGTNGRGQLGDGTTQDRPAPTAVAGGRRFLTVAGGFAHTCAIAESGDAYCWGGNDYGQLGDGTDTARLVPTRVASAVRFTALEAGGSVSCGLSADRQLYCWGYGPTLGTDAPQSCASNGTPQGCARTPVLVGAAGVSGFGGVDISGAHGCAIGSDGHAYCWGDNAAGQLGNGTLHGSAVPGLVAGSIRFATVGTGSLHSCGLSLEGVVYCWGSNAYGQLGDGSGVLGWPTPTAVWGW